MSKKFCTLAFVVAIFALLLSGMNYHEIALMREKFVNLQQNRDVQFVVYLGTNDKDSNKPVFNRNEANSKLNEILAKHFEGFTVFEAIGGWTDSTGKISNEYTIVIHLSDTNIEKVHKASDELIKVFNQTSVLIQTNETRTEFYQ